MSGAPIPTTSRHLLSFPIVCRSPFRLRYFEARRADFALNPNDSDLERPR
jgi:hypothetical protein